MSETAPREVGSVSPVRFTGSGSPQSPGRREVSPEGTTTAPGFPPLAATPAPAGQAPAPALTDSEQCERLDSLTFSEVERICDLLDLQLAAIFHYPVRRRHRA